MTETAQPSCAVPAGSGKEQRLVACTDVFDRAEAPIEAGSLARYSLGVTPREAARALMSAVQTKDASAAAALCTKEADILPGADTPLRGR